MRGESYGFFHDSAAGDFLLMSRGVADAIRGYVCVCVCVCVCARARARARTRARARACVCVRVDIFNEFAYVYMIHIDTRRFRPTS